jgi:hypothetical protein
MGLRGEGEACMESRETLGKVGFEPLFAYATSIE